MQLSWPGLYHVVSPQGSSDPDREAAALQWPHGGHGQILGDGLPATPSMLQTISL